MNQVVEKDIKNKTLTIKRVFQASADKLWAAWSDEKLLSNWWGPREWPTTTKSFDFRPGGHWHYCMTGPEGTQSWGWVDYTNIQSPKSFEAKDSFSDQEGHKSDVLPHTQWNVSIEGDSPTTLITKLTFNSEADMQKIIEMGFEAGMTESLDKLEEQLVGGN
jgi:uncharacterized protein YndB with AHSA1/START domain